MNYCAIVLYMLIIPYSSTLDYTLCPEPCRPAPQSCRPVLCLIIFSIATERHGPFEVGPSSYAITQHCIGTNGPRYSIPRAKRDETATGFEYTLLSQPDPLSTSLDGQ